MARRGCASGRRKQLQRLKKALFECRVFDPTIFDWAASAHTDKTPPVPPIYRSYVAPVPEELASETAPAPTSVPISRVRLRAPTRLALSHMASVRLPTRPLPVSAQIKKRVSQSAPAAHTTNQKNAKPKIQAVQPTRLSITTKNGSWISLKGEIPTTPRDNYNYV